MGKKKNVIATFVVADENLELIKRVAFWKDKKISHLVNEGLNFVADKYEADKLPAIPDVTVPESVEKFTHFYMPNDFTLIKASQVQHDYILFCEKNGYKRVTKYKLTKYLDELGYERKRMLDGFYYRKKYVKNLQNM